MNKPAQKTASSSQIMSLLNFLPAQQRPYIKKIIFENPDLLILLQDRLNQKKEAIKKHDLKTLRSIELKEMAETQKFLEQLEQFKTKGNI